MSIEAMKQALEALEFFEIAGLSTLQTVDAIKSIRQVIAAYESSPPECQTEAEKKAYAFGWWKAMEAQRSEKQEPVAWVSYADLQSAAVTRNRGGLGDTHTWSETPNAYHPMPLYTHPQPKREWVGLTDEQIHIRYKAMRGDKSPRYIEIYRDCENAHGIKGK
jgi:hypothetical protein